MRRGEAWQVPQGVAATPCEQALLALWLDLDEDAQREIQRAAEEKKRLGAAGRCRGWQKAGIVCFHREQTSGAKLLACFHIAKTILRIKVI